MTDAAAIGAALTALAAGDPVVLLEPEGDTAAGHVLLAAEDATAETIATLDRLAGGMLFLCLPEERCDALELRALGGADDRWRPTMSIDLRGGDRAATIAAAVDPARGAEDFVRPGLVNPLRVAAGGIIARRGRAEAALELVVAAGRTDAALLWTVRGESGVPADRTQVARLARRHDFPLVTVDDVLAYRQRTGPLVERVTDALLPTPFGEFRSIPYRDLWHGEHHLALARGDLAGAEDVPVRAQRRCVLGDTLRSRGCTCRDELLTALGSFAEAPAGLLIYLIGDPMLEPRAHAEQPEADPWLDAVTWQIVRELGVRSVRLLHGGASEVVLTPDPDVPISGAIALRPGPAASPRA